MVSEGFLPNECEGLDHWHPDGKNVIKGLPFFEDELLEGKEILLLKKGAHEVQCLIIIHDLNGLKPRVPESS